MFPNPKKRKGGFCIRIGVRVLGKFGGWVEPDPREGDNVKRVGVSQEFY